MPCSRIFKHVMLAQQTLSSHCLMIFPVASLHKAASLQTTQRCYAASSITWHFYEKDIYYTEGSPCEHHSHTNKDTVGLLVILKHVTSRVFVLRLNKAVMKMRKRRRFGMKVMKTWVEVSMGRAIAKGFSGMYCGLFNTHTTLPHCDHKTDYNTEPLTISWLSVCLCSYYVTGHYYLIGLYNPSKN